MPHEKLLTAIDIEETIHCCITSAQWMLEGTCMDGCGIMSLRLKQDSETPGLHIELADGTTYAVTITPLD